ncbi:MAG: ATP F0F1 synthase subunit B [Hyphomonadaceae bacterium]|nr:ATP F0F1 synthase subunit B [Hyphomonadaceae bacterium]
MEITATEIAFVALVLFIGLLVYLKVPEQVMKALDARSQAIAKELHDARRLREEAEALLADYQAKRAAAEADAKAIVESAKEQAAAVAEETRKSMMAAMARREKQAEDRIASAESKAADDVRAAAVEAAVAAAERLIRERMNDKAQSALIDEGVAELKRKFG